jgi:uncharacterized protein with LGFP repeats
MCCSAGTLAALADGRSGPITRLWRKLGGASGPLGLPLGPEASVPGGWGQSFEHGFIATTKRGTWAVRSPLWQRYQSLRGPSGPLGVPVGAATEPVRGIVTQQFSGGILVWSRATGAQPLTGVMLARWRHDGGLRSQESLPTGARIGLAQQFLGGGLYATPTGVHLVPGAIRDRYEELGGPSSVLGLPSSEAAALGTARIVRFEVGALIETTIAGHTVVL